ncbi:hypothetical protein SD427_16285 [Chryseobacterium sp. JJR-5R]|uniref:DUF7336 domain-containing protein n=1 Tax=Chryseobacterium sp. JJR-5R TaxID=3093923 RepID=UPI002A75CF19|nr:hypothetical protein [Chryseobacterium sp. JJR-5R]WPO82301.1 hypothetical protein SD427_16285 [Chryseobacterium sp. JJR-5R]
MKYFVYAIDHTYTDELSTSTKLLGFCDGIEGLEKIKQEALKLSGFNRYPNSFIINKYILDKVYWKNGFENIIGEIGRDYLLEGDNLIDETYLSIKNLGLESVFSVSHNYTIDRYLDDERFIGVFSSEEKAEKAIEKLKKQNGFILHPDDFDLSELEINNLLWKSGF